MHMSSAIQQVFLLSKLKDFVVNRSQFFLFKLFINNKKSKLTHMCQFLEEVDGPL